MIPERYAPQVYALFRIVIGFMFMVHGLQKILGLFGGMQGQTAVVGTLPWFAGIIELVGGALVMIGLLTRAAAFICSGEMAVAYFMMHQPRGGLPQQNGGEGAVLFCFAFLYIAARGAGLWSADGGRRTRLRV
jgi:putative oxidoreductase